jgi:hypothetical protein
MTTKFSHTRVGDSPDLWPLSPAVCYLADLAGTRPKGARHCCRVRSGPAERDQVHTEDHVKLMIVSQSRTIEQYTDSCLVELPGEDLGVDENALRRRGIILAMVGALLIALAMLSGWPA